MKQTFACPLCGEVLWIRGNSPARITCPKCLKLVVNPNARIPPVVEPRDVVPVEEEIRKDTIDVGRLLGVLWVSLLAGGILAATAGGDLSLGLLLIVPAVVIAIVTGLVFAKAPRRYAPQVEVEPPARPDGQVVLDYAHHRKRQESDVEDSFRIGAFMSGFFIAIVVAGLGFMGLINSKGNEEGIFVLVVTGVAIVGVAYGGYQLGRYPQFNGIGRGVAVGLVLAMMALVPFGACFDVEYANVGDYICAIAIIFSMS
jgi:hypothetical protein